MPNLSRYHAFLLTAVLAVFAASAIRPFDRLTWWLEVMPTILGLIALAVTWTRFRFSDVVLTFIALHMILLCVGGHYTYALVPLGEWVKDWLHLSRNHYDRLGHFAQGFVPTLVAREIFVRRKVVAVRGWMGFLLVCVALAISAAYELIEWAAAEVSAEAAEAFLGTQGDNWDTQKDIALALLGALVVVLFLTRWHDRAMARMRVEG
jgi:putative membrane protein